MTMRRLASSRLPSAAPVRGNMVAAKIAVASPIIAALQTGGRLGFGLRAAGLALLADGEIDFGIVVHAIGQYIIALTFEVIESIDKAISFGQIVEYGYNRNHRE